MCLLTLHLPRPVLLHQKLFQNACFTIIQRIGNCAGSCSVIDITDCTLSHLNAIEVSCKICLCLRLLRITAELVIGSMVISLFECIAVVE